jgi:hypothetical protein
VGRDRRGVLVQIGFRRVLHVAERHGRVRMAEQLLQPHNGDTRLGGVAWPPTAQAALAAGILGVLGLVAAALITARAAKDSRLVRVEELITVLNGRADRILRDMDKEDAAAIASIKSGKRAISQANFLTRSRATRALFVDLQRRHVDALRRGDLVAAHEILADIQEVLSHRAYVIFDAHAPVGLYALDPRYYEEYSRHYPGK